MTCELEQNWKQKIDIVQSSWFTMPKPLNSRCKYSYTHHNLKDQSRSIDVHDVTIINNRKPFLLSYSTAFLVLASFILLLLKEKLNTNYVWSMFLIIIIARLLHHKPIKKESIIIMPEFGVQLETHYWSGSISRHFVPIGKILKPVLNECVTPVKCYWSLALILRGEQQLLLVFQRYQPPLNVLVPVWKALCAATDFRESKTTPT